MFIGFGFNVPANNVGFAAARPLPRGERAQLAQQRFTDRMQLGQEACAIHQDIYNLRQSGASHGLIQAQRQSDWGQYRADRLQDRVDRFNQRQAFRQQSSGYVAPFQY